MSEDRIASLFSRYCMKSSAEGFSIYLRSNGFTEFLESLVATASSLLPLWSAENGAWLG